jgi:predicted Zn-dependent peptidase
MIKKMLAMLILSIFFLPTILNTGTRQTNEFPLPVTQFTLENGLRIILSEDTSLPVVSVVVTYKVGSIHEQPGKAGLAYLVENLMFQGSRNVGQMQHIRFIQKIGGVLNATTTEDKTSFYQTVPSNQLALVLWLESDRMKSLNISPSNVERLKASLIEEIEIRQISDPYFESTLLFDELLYPDFSYSHPVIGTVQDIRNITARDVENFYRTYYTPNNSVLAITGDINRTKVRPLIQKYFATIPRGDNPTPPRLQELPPIEHTVESITDALAPSPGYFIGYQIAPRYSSEYYPLVLIEYILLKGRTSRFHRKLIEKDKTVLHLNGGIETRADQTVFKIFVRAANEIMKERSQKALLSEINRLKTNFVSEQELNKSKNMFKMDYVKQYATTLDRAIFLAEQLLNRGSFEEFSGELDRHLSVTRYEVSRMINKYFNENNLIILNVKTK